MDIFKHSNKKNVVKLDPDSFNKGTIRCNMSKKKISPSYFSPKLIKLFNM